MYSGEQARSVTDENLSLLRYVVGGVVAASAVSTLAIWGLGELGVPPPTAVTVGVLFAPGVAIGVPLLAIARRVGSRPDDPEATERRLADRLGSAGWESDDRDP